MRFKIDWASLIVGSKFTVFALFYFVFEGNFPSTSPLEAYIWRGDLTEGFLHYRFGGLYLEGLIFGILRYFNTPLGVDGDFIERESEREAYLRGGGLIEDLLHLSPIE